MTSEGCSDARLERIYLPDAPRPTDWTPGFANDAGLPAAADRASRRPLHAHAALEGRRKLTTRAVMVVRSTTLPA